MEEQQSNYVVTLMHANYIIRHNYIFFIRPKNDFLKGARIVTLTKVRERREKVSDGAAYPYRTVGVRYLPHCGSVLVIYARA